MLRTVQSLPHEGLLTLGSDPTRFPRPNRQPATAPPGSYPHRTHTGKRRRAYDQSSLQQVTSSLLGARILGASQWKTFGVRVHRLIA
jgi:hypothetical protein